MSKDEVLKRINQLDALYKELDILDEKLKNKKINQINHFVQELEIQEKINKLFEI